MPNQGKAPKIFTRQELNVLDQCEHGLNIKDAAELLHVSRETICAWLEKLGIRERPKHHSSNRKFVPWNSSLRCSNCQILLSQVPYSQNGLCDECLDIMQTEPKVVDSRFEDAALVAEQDVSGGWKRRYNGQ